MPKEFFLAKGLIRRLETSIGKSFGEFNLNRFVRETLKKYRVAFFDDCCPTASDLTPVQYNATTGQFEYFNSTWNGVNPQIVKHTASAANATATLTSTQVKTGLITSTSAAATSLTLPSATAMGTALGAARGTWFDFAVDNSGGASAVTLVPGTGTTAQSALTGGTNLVVAAGTVGIFRFYFTLATTNIIARLV